MTSIFIGNDAERLKALGRYAHTSATESEVILHGHTIAKFEKEYGGWRKVTFDSGGHVSRTTVKRLNQIANAINLAVKFYIRRGVIKWSFVFTQQGGTESENRAFYDGMYFLF